MGRQYIIPSREYLEGLRKASKALDEKIPQRMIFEELLEG